MLEITSLPRCSHIFFNVLSGKTRRKEMRCLHVPVVHSAEGLFYNKKHVFIRRSTKHANVNISILKLNKSHRCLGKSPPTPQRAVYIYTIHHSTGWSVVLYSRRGRSLFIATRLHCPYLLRAAVPDIYAAGYCGVCHWRLCLLSSVFCVLNML